MHGNHIVACTLLVLAYFLVASAVALWFIPLDYKSRKKALRKYLSLVLLAFSIHLLQWALVFGQGENDFAQRWTTAWSRTFQYFSLDAPYADIIKEATGAFPKTEWVYAFNVLSCIYVIIAPITGGAFLLGLLTSLIPHFRLMLNLKKTKFVFSELNDRSIALAENIARLSWQLRFFQRGKHSFEKEYIDLRERRWLKSACFVFTDAYVDKESEISSELLARAKQIGAICLKDDILEQSFHWLNPHKKIVYFLIDSKEENNFTAALSLLGDKKNLWKGAAKRANNRGVDMYVFTQEQEAVRLIDEACARLTIPAPLLVKCVNEYRNVVYKMFDDRELITSLLTKDEPTQSPLLSVWDSFKQSEKNELRIVVLGAGRLAREYIKTAAWYLQMLQNLNRDQGQNVETEYKTIAIRIMVFAKGAKQLETQLKGECRELFEADYEAKFFEADFLSEEFVQEFNGQKAAEAQRYLVALGDDIVNYNATIWLWREINKHNSVAGRRSSCIVDFAIEDDEFFKKILNEVVSNKEDKIYMRPFSTMCECFSYKNVRMDDLEQRALQADQAHNPKSTREFLSAYDRDSSIASALHMICKIFSLCTKGVPSREILRNMIVGTNPVWKRENQIYWLEHRRWCAYMRAQGYTCPTVKQFIDIAYTITDSTDTNFVWKTQKNERLRLHACLLRSNADCRSLANSLSLVVKKWYPNDTQKSDQLLTEISSGRFQEAKKIMAGEIAALKQKIVNSYKEREDGRLAEWLSEIIDLGNDNNTLDALDRLSILATLTLDEGDKDGYRDFKKHDIKISRTLYREVMQLRVKNFYDECFAPKHIASVKKNKEVSNNTNATEKAENQEADNNTPMARLEKAIPYLRKTLQKGEDLLAVSYGEESDLIMLLERGGKNCFGTLYTGDDTGKTTKRPKINTVSKHGILIEECRLVEVPHQGTVCLGRLKKTTEPGDKQNAVFMHLYWKKDAETDEERYLELELNSPRALSKKQLKKRLGRAKAEEKCDNAHEKNKKNSKNNDGKEVK